MKCFSLQTTSNDFDQKIEAWKDKGIQLVMLFTSTDILKSTDLGKKVSAALPDAQIIGCSTSGEIGDRVEDDSISVLGLVFEKATFKCVSVPVDGPDGSRKAGSEIAQQLMGDNLVGVFTLLPGVNVNGSKFTLGLKDVLPENISVSGGLAGDGLNFKETATLHNEQVQDSYALGLGIYGDNVEMRSGSRGGWKPFGPLRRVTKVENNILYELDGKPALELYKEYLGEKAADLPSSGLLYPLAIMDGEGNEEGVGLIRTILDIDEENKSLVLAGDLELGQHVCLMHANTDELVDGAEEAAKAALGDSPDSGSESAVICVSCVGRKILMGDDTEDELDAVRLACKGNKFIVGFYSYGEICHFQDTGQPELHNQTMTVTYISENMA